MSRTGRPWFDDAYPAIAKRAKEEDAEIHWGDETGLRNDSQHGRPYAPRGKTPAIIFSGKVRFMTYQEKMNADVLIRFLKRLVKDADQKIFLVLDNLPVHHGKNVKH